MWRIMAIVLVVLFAGVANSSDKPNLKTADPKNNAETEQRGSDKNPVTVKVLPSTDAEAKAAQEEKYRNDKSIQDEKLADATVLLAYVTIVLAGFTALLWLATFNLARDAKRTADRQTREMQESLRIARESAKASRDAADIAHAAMIAGERAFVFALGFKQYCEKDGTTGLYHWRFRPTWMNSGNTPTKKMTIHTRYMLRDGKTPLPIGFNFDYPTSEVGVALVAPKTPSEGGMVPPPKEAAISPQDILDMQAGRKILYLMGWAKYSDIFPNTPPHITRFCWVIHVSGNPMTITPGPEGSKLTGFAFAYNHHDEGNCTDEECG